MVSKQPRYIDFFHNDGYEVSIGLETGSKENSTTNKNAKQIDIDASISEILELIKSADSKYAGVSSSDDLLELLQKDEKILMTKKG